MKRSGFKRNEWLRQPQPALRPLATAPNYASASAAAQPVAKGEFMRHEGYRRIVAGLPCMACQIVGYSQAAHANHGKGAGLKTDDRTCFPLCCDRPGVKGCHARFDQYELYPKAAAALVADAWGADTRRRIEMMGQWPEDLPKLEVAKMCDGSDGISWMAEQLGAMEEPPKQKSHNPRPPGVIRPGSGSDVLLRFLQQNPARHFFHHELVLALGRSKGEVDWALIFLKDAGLIEAFEVNLPGRRSVMRYVLSFRQAQSIDEIPG